MKGKVRAKGRLWLVLVVASALVIGLGVPRTSQATCPSSCSEYPSYDITIDENVCSPLNDTWDLTQAGSYCIWHAELEEPFTGLELYCSSNTWRAVFYHLIAPETEWVDANVTDYPAGPYEHDKGGCTGGTMIVHQP
jgi:hypothetical protein